MNMDCRDAEQQLVFFHWGEGESATRADIEAHLSQCAPCLRSYWALKRGLEESSRPGAGPAPSSLLREKIRAVVLPLPRRRPAWAPLAGFGAVAATLFVLLVGFPARRPPPVKSLPVDNRTRLDDVDSSRPEPATLHFL